MLSMTIAIGPSASGRAPRGRTIDRLIRVYARGSGHAGILDRHPAHFRFHLRLECFRLRAMAAASSLAAYLFLPALTVALALSPFLIRNLRSSMIREMAADHVTAARSRGLPERAIFRNQSFSMR